MDILFIIYIFALFVIFSPNFIFQYSKSNNLLVAILHAIIFSIVVYVTYNSVTKTQTEGVTFGTYDKNDKISTLNVTEMNLGGVLKDPSDDKKPKDVQYSNEIAVSSPTTAEEDKIIATPPYDYNNFRTYDYENMEKKLKMLESHKHTNHYFDLVPNFNEKKHEILCAADHDTNKPCCRQPNSVIPESNQCDALKPYCKDYIAGEQWGKCVPINPYPKPNLVYDSPMVLNPVSPSGETKPTEVVKIPDGTVIIQECPVQSPAPAPPALAPALAPPPAQCISSSFMVVGGAGTNSMAWSEDGRSWNVTREAGIGPRGLAWNGSIWVAVGSGTNSIAWSEDGKTWNGLGTTVFNGYNGYGFGRGVAWNGSMWVALGTGTNTIAWSEDGKNWTGLGSSIFSEGFDVAWNGSMWVAVGVPPGGWRSQGGNSIAWSEDGKTWNYINTWNVFGNDGGVKIAWNGSIWVAGGVGGNGGTLAWSEDGKNWTSVTNWQNRGNARCSGLAWNGSMWLATGVGIDGNNTISRSEDGKNWTLVSNTENNGGTDVAWNGSVWVILGNQTNTMAWSNDGENWTGLGRQIFTTYGLAIASKNVLPYTDKWANCQ